MSTEQNTPPLAGQQLEEAVRRFVFEDGPAPHGVIDVDELLTDEQLAAWEALCDSARPGPWQWVAYGPSPDDPEPTTFLMASCDVPGSAHEGMGHTFDECGFPVLRCHWDGQGQGTSDPAPGPDDAAFIVAARMALPLLLAEVRRLRGVEAEFRQWVPYLPLTPKCVE